MTKKKVAIGCLATIGGIVIIILAISIIVSIISTHDTEEPPAKTQAPAETERSQLPVQTTPSKTGGEELEEGEEVKESEGSEVGEEPLIPVQVGLIEAQSQGDIVVVAFGTGSSTSANLFISSESDKLLDVVISPGTIFESPTGTFQSMVVTTERVLSVEPHESIEPISIDAISINMELDVAHENDNFVLSMAPATGDIMKLLNLVDFHEETFRVRQFTIWTIIDNPGRNEYATIGTLGSGSGPSDEEIEGIRYLFDKAGISLEGYFAFQKPVYVELTEAKNRGVIVVTVCGDNSIDRIRMTINSKSDDTLEIAVLPGTIFVPQAASVQSMVIIAEKLLLLYPYETVGPISIDAACASMQLDVPSKSDDLSLGITPAPEDLKKLLELPDFHEETFRVRQFAIWTITDNPGRNDYVGIATGFQIFGTGPSDEEIERIRSLFVKAGISITKYKAL